MTLLTDIYNIPNNKRIRGAAKNGWTRPTVSQFLTTVPDFNYIENVRTYFGDSSDGNLETTGNVSFSSTLDGDTVYKNFNNLTINSGHTVTVANRCKGMVIYCYGDCIIDGTLTMTARGCKGAGELFAPNGLDKIETEDSVIDLSIPAIGGVGGNRVHNTSSRLGIVGNTGANTNNGACGGGGSGAIYRWDNGDAYSGAGATGTTWCGGAGGGGCCSNSNSSVWYAGNGGTDGGAGGAGLLTDGFSQGYAGGGAGNPGGGGNSQVGDTTYVLPTNGAGGLLLLIVKGTLIVNGIIASVGSAGGFRNSPSGGWPSNGGSSGGGSITVLHYGTYTNTGSITAAGGTSSPGGAGGTGSTRIHKVL